MALVDYGSDKAAGTVFNRTDRLEPPVRLHKLTIQVTLLRKTARQIPRTATLTSPIAIGRLNTMQQLTWSVESGFWLVASYKLLVAQDQLRTSALSCCGLLFARMGLHICSVTRVCRFLQSKST